MHLQDNKAVNLALATPSINRIIINPGETFSFWRLVGNCTKKKGYKEGLTISNGKTIQGIGGGMCQFTNLLNWLTLHSPLDIVECHNHNRFDLFPDFNRQVPFGTGTSIFYNYLDYRVRNNTSVVFQFIVYTTEEYLCGELRASEALEYSHKIIEKDLHFVKKDDTYYRRNRIFRTTIDKKTGDVIKTQLLKENNAKVMYSSEFIKKELIRE